MTGLAAFDIRDFFEVGFLALVFLLPALRGLLGGKDATKKGARRAPPRAPVRGAPPARPAAPSGMEMWERLLRGEVEPAPPPKSVPPPVPPPVLTAAQRTAPKPSSRAKPSPEPSLSRGPLVSRAARSQPLPSSTPTEATASGEFGGMAPAEYSEDALEAGLQEVGRPAPLAAIGEGGDVAAEDLSLAELGREETVAAAPARTGRVFDGPRDWRRAVVLAEVLGRPLGLRDERASTVPGLSS